MRSDWQTAFQRHERKFPLSATLWERAIERAAQLLPVERFDGVHDRVTIQTLYLDTPALDSYREYLESCPIRRKIRIRQYGYNGSVNGVCWLEIKVRHHDMSTKRRFRCERDQLGRLLEGEDLAEHVRAMNPNAAEALGVYRAARELIVERRMRPVARVKYQRIAFQDPRRPAIRLTVDRDIRFDAVRRAGVRYSGIVFEAKFHDEDPDWLETLMRDLAVEDWSRFSKYARAVRDLGLAGHG